MSGDWGYDTIAIDLEQRIAGGEWPPGARLPSQQAMAEHYGVHRRTIADAYRVLRERRLIRGRQGLAVFVVAADQLTKALAALEAQRRRDVDEPP